MPPPDTQQQVIIGTAGHIDHGKTALVKALTGVDADTLEEEKRRGITIELGFVFMPLGGARQECRAYPRPTAPPEGRGTSPRPTEAQIVFIDVPGHERLVRTMVAGAANLDAAMLVIAADEGVAAQTREHLDILRLLGVQHGLVALTKADLVDEARLQVVTEQIRAFVADSFLAEAPIIPVSAVTQAGIEALRRTLTDLARQVTPRQDSGVFRMPVDRVFTMHGFGTVVAGTVLSGHVQVGDQVEVFPEGLTARVRGVQVHGQKEPRSWTGRRTALNVPDLKKDDLRRGQTAGAPGSLQPTTRLDAQLFLLPSADELKHRARVRLHLGTDEVIARVTLLDRERVAPGDTATVQFALERAAVAVARDRFVVRTFSPLMTIGGGAILDAAPPRHRRFDEDLMTGLAELEGDARQVVARTLRDAREPRSLQGLVLDTGQPESAVEAAVAELLEEGEAVRLGDGQVLHRERLDEQRDRLVGLLRAYYERHPARLWMPLPELQSQFLQRAPRPVLDYLLRDLQATGVLVRREVRVRLADRRIELPPAEQKLAERLEALYRRAGLSTPAEDDVREELRVPAGVFSSVMTALVEQEILVRLSDRVTVHAEPLQALRERVRNLIERHGSLTVAHLRDEAGVSRKYALAALEYFDQIGYTRREGDARVLKP
ncbi:selenocysteine-specific translation elongation factor [bacterium]|nr:selenocysteine-specific translation elongation factor [bacterium]